MLSPFRNTLGRIHIAKEITKEFMIVESTSRDNRTLGKEITGDVQLMTTR